MVAYRKSQQTSSSDVVSAN